MIPLPQTAPAEIRLLLKNLNDSNSDSVSQQLLQYIGYGTEGSILFLQTCLDNLTVYGKDLKNMQLEPVVISVFKYMLEKPNFSTVFCESLKNTAVSEDFLENLSTALQLSASEKIGFGLALSDSENLDMRMCGKNFCVAKIGELCANSSSVDSTEIVQGVLMFLNGSEGLSMHADSFMQMVLLVQLKEDSEFILAPLLSDELRGANLLRNLDSFSEGGANDFDAVLAEMEKEIGMADTFKELGYKCTVDISSCKQMLSQFLPLTETTVAKILGTVAHTNSGLEDSEIAFSTFCSAFVSSSSSDLPSSNTWNTDVLIDSIKQLAPGIKWTAVIENLDHEGFYVPDEAAFTVLMKSYRRACHVCDVAWMFVNTSKYRNFSTEGYVDVVNGHKFQPGHANHAWLCLDILKVLCLLAERGLASSVHSLLEHPLKHCPEVLLLGMAYISECIKFLKEVQFGTVAHTNSGHEDSEIAFSTFCSALSAAVRQIFHLQTHGTLVSL